MLKIADNVKWSDGQPLTADDVVYSLTAGKQDKAMDIIGLFRAGSNIVSIKKVAGNSVAITLKQPDSQFIAANLNLQLVVPKHIWSKVRPSRRRSRTPNPVGSGPFTKITRLTTQDIVFSKNPTYWKAGSPKIPCLEYTETTSNDAALLSIQSGKVDWTHNFVPNVESAYEAKDPAHYHAFYATTAYPVSLMFDDTQYPYSLVPFRQAVSMSINRSDVSKLGEYGYAPPTDAIGLGGIFPSWVTDPAIKAEAQRLATYNPDGAKKLLTDNGFTYSGSKLLDPKGNPVSLEVHVIGGWSDWVASLQIITKNLQAIGIDATVKIEPDWNSWYPSASSTKAPTLLWQNASQGSPYGFFYANLHQNALIPSGPGRHRDRQLGALLRSQRDGPPEPVEEVAQAGRPARAGDEGAGRVAEDAAGRAALHRAALVDLQHEVLPLLRVAEELLRRPDLHDVPRQRPLVHADLPRRAVRSVTGR